MKSMFQQKPKKKPPPRPPTPNFIKYRSKSSYNLTQETPNLIEWSPPSSPKPEKSHQFGGSVSSSYSSSTSSIASSKKSLENDPGLFNLNFSPTSTLNWISNNSKVKENQVASVRPRIIRAAPPKKVFTSKDESPTNISPPMPKVPPPSPPKGTCDVVTPYGIALFDFPASQPGDLALQVNDVVVLLRRVNKEWLYGRVCDREGIFPENFVQIEVPLPGEDKMVTALYEFKPQIPGDLELKPGSAVRIIKEISADWLYGECEGKTGQFPKNFVS